MTKYEKLQQEFNELSGVQQWKWAIAHKDDIRLMFGTIFYFTNDLKATPFVFKGNIFKRPGIADLLEAIGFDAEQV